MAEPAAPPTERKPKTWLTLLVAAMLGIAAGRFAPDTWPEGDGSIGVTREGETVARVAVGIGNPEPVRIDIAAIMAEARSRAQVHVPDVL